MYRYDKQELLSVAPAAFSRIRSVRFQDVDAAGVIFYPRLFEYCHDVYVEFLEAHASPLHEVLRKKTWAAPIRHAEADYLRPLRFGDRIDVRLARAHLTPSEVTLGFQVLLLTTNEMAAVAQSVHTFLSLPTFQRCEVPTHLFTAFQSLVS